MKINTHRWWSLPGPRRFLQEIVSQLDKPKSVLMSLPLHAPEGLYDAVADAVRRNSGKLQRIRLNPGPGGGGERPESAVLGAFRIPERLCSLRSEDIVACESLHGRIAWIENIGPEAWPQWQSFLQEYAEACRQHTNPVLHPLRFLIPLSAEMTQQAPAGDVFLGSVKWFGYVDELDMQIYVSEQMHSSGMSHRMSDRTRRLILSMISCLAGSDPYLATLLLEASAEDIWSPHRILLELAREREWTVRLPENVWHLGHFDKIGGAKSFHSAYLAVNDEDGFKRRLWRSQVKILLPEIEEYGFKMLDRLPRRSKRYTYEGNLKELTHLRRELEGIISTNEWNILDTYYYIRNELAHLRPVSAGELQALGYG